MRPGQQVKVRAHGGMVLERTVVYATENTIVICRTDEWKKAQDEKRKPICVGFPIGAVVTGDN